MGMTDNQFKSHRRFELDNYEEMLEIAKEECKPGSRLIGMLLKEIDRARADVEA